MKIEVLWRCAIIDRLETWGEATAWRVSGSKPAVLTPFPAFCPPRCNKHKLAPNEAIVSRILLYAATPGCMDFGSQLISM